ncbi:MAG: ATP-dependent zinc metalloprotease FtsH [Candidatus Tectimicrobiota bacterium]|nr:MAG: ATP-dependent zinc metalloprotease FtsH [Candidatus Tectomicrobia bacterium]
MQTPHKFSIGYFLAALAALLALQVLLAPTPPRLSYLEFKRALQAGKIERVVISDELIHGWFKPEAVAAGQPRAFVTVRVPDPELVKELEARGVDFSGHYESPLLKTLLTWVIPALFVVGLWAFLYRRLTVGSGVMAFGKSRARIYAEKSTGVTFDDVAGQEEAKEELREIVEFLKNPKKFRLLGGRLPRGVLLVGPPGTGKTLLAKAVAGEANVPFFSISGTEFVELFVGVGAARVRDLFAQAQAKAPCIVFIDELDALGKARGIGGVAGGHDEREHTLNQLLVEMDGFDTSKGVIILAATNRPELLDPALLRPGRFDRQILVDRPDVRGREAILRVHAKHVKLAPDVDLKVLAQRTPGFVGADLANVVNEAALLAARKNKNQVEMADFEEAIDRIVAGLEKKNRVINPRERQIVAVHETGHALVAAFTPGADRVHKISIIPRGIGALGHTQQLPTEDRYLMTRQELLAKIDVLFGGRAAELLVFGEVSTGAQDDLRRATEIARAMVLEYGMGETLGPAAFPRVRPRFLPEPWGYTPDGTREYSEATARALDLETKKILDERMAHVLQLLRDKRPLLERIAALLLEKEVLEGEEFWRLVREATPAPAS